MVPTSNVLAVTLALTPGESIFTGGLVQRLTVSLAPDVLNSILITMKFVAVLLRATGLLPRADAPPSAVLLTVPNPKNVSDSLEPARKPAKRLVGLLPLKNTPTESPPEL